MNETEHHELWLCGGHRRKEGKPMSQHEHRIRNGRYIHPETGITVELVEIQTVVRWNYCWQRPEEANESLISTRLETSTGQLVIRHDIDYRVIEIATDIGPVTLFKVEP